MSSHKKYLNMAAGVALSGSKRRNYMIGAVGIRSDGAIVVSYNGHSQFPERTIHAEYRCAKKLDSGAVVYVARIRIDGSWGNAKPCHSCMKTLISRGVSKIYYTTGINTFESMML